MQVHAVKAAYDDVSAAAPTRESARTSASAPEYRVRLASTAELEAVFKLRYDVFYREMGADDAVSAVSGLDVDNFDEVCDHLVVTHGEAIVGTYRLLPRRKIIGTGLDLYSEGEFDLSAMKDAYGADILELGRSCVHPDYRTGVIPKLLWAGIAQYMLVHGIRALTGCVSVHGVSDVQALRLRDALRERGNWHDVHDCAVRQNFEVSPEARAAYAEQMTMVPCDPFQLIPPLMKGYFNLGAKVCGGPAHDAPFHCHDFLVLLDTRDINPKYFKSLVQPLVERRMIGELRR
jgi:putative hemolysin